MLHLIIFIVYVVIIFLLFWFIIDNERKLKKKSAYAEITILPLSVVMILISYWQEVYSYHIILVILFIIFYCFLFYISFLAFKKGYEKLKK